MPDDSDSRPSNTRANTVPRAWLVVDIAEDAGDWSMIKHTQHLIEDGARALEAHEHFKAHRRAEACIALSGNANVQKLNATYRGQDKATNVLSFPSGPAPSTYDGEAQPLGDVVLALETLLSEAREQDISPADHLQHLVVHGLLHLLGFDHETDHDAEVMEALEVEILATLGIANPYAETANTI